MKIIHTADLHLGSPLGGVKDPELRRHELVTALAHLSEYANNSGAQAIVIAGDLFDEKFVSAQTVQSVAEIIRHSNATWFIMRGNHGGSAPYDDLHDLCPEAGFFGDEWTYYTLDNVTICGRELGHNDAENWDKLVLNPANFNILVLHGDIDDDSYGVIDKRALSNSLASYVALGHRHGYCEHKFGRVRACYSGTLEARGFDESANTGFVEIDTEHNTVRFVQQAIRSVVTIRIDVTGIVSDVALSGKISQAIADVNPRNYLNAIFVGTQESGLHLQMVARQLLEDRFFALRIKDDTKPSFNLAEIQNEVSLRGEFVKLAMQIEDPAFRDEVLKLGLSALEGTL